MASYYYWSRTSYILNQAWECKICIPTSLMITLTWTTFPDIQCETDKWSIIAQVNCSHNMASKYLKVINVHQIYQLWEHGLRFK